MPIRDKVFDRPRDGADARGWNRRRRADRLELRPADREPAVRRAGDRLEDARSSRRRSLRAWRSSPARCRRGARRRSARSRRCAPS